MIRALWVCMHAIDVHDVHVSKIAVRNALGRPSNLTVTTENASSSSAGV